MPATCRARAVGSLGSSGWIARIERLLCDAADDSPEVAYLTYLTGFQAILSRDLQTAAVDLADRSRLLSGAAIWTCRPSPSWRWVAYSSSAATSPVASAFSTRRWSQSTPGRCRRSWSATATAPPSTRAMTCSTYVAARYGHPAPRKGSSPESNSHAPAMASSQNPLYVPPPDRKNAMSHTPHAPELARVGLTAPTACTPSGGCDDEHPQAHSWVRV